MKQDITIETNKSLLKEQIINKFEQWKSEIISLVDEDFVSKQKKGDQEEEKKPRNWADLLIADHFSNERDYIKRKFKIVKQTNDGVIIQCTLWGCGFQLNSRGEGWHWKKHTRLLEKINFSIEEGKIKVVCKSCSPNKMMDIFDALEHFKSQHYQDFQKTKLFRSSDVS